MLEELIEELKKLDAKTLELITDLVKQLNKRKE
jgi:mRNA-degrading endonuclease RelE of RelBE toxin-antitoxin system